MLALAGWPAAPASASEAPALTVAEGSVARRQVIALGRDLEVRGEARSDAVAVNGSVRVSGSIGGDLIVLGGDAVLAERARVGGDVFVLGGKIAAKRGSVIGGRSVSYPTVSSAWLVLLEGPTLGLPAFSGVVVGAKLALVAAWLLWSTLAMAITGREVLTASERLGANPMRMFLLGLGGVLSLFLTALFLSSWAASVVGAPLLFLVVLILLFLKLWGSVAVFHAAGNWITRRLGQRFGRRWSPLNALVVGLLVLGLAKFVPVAGVWIWTVVTLLGVGTALETRLGRSNGWVETRVPGAL